MHYDSKHNTKKRKPDVDLIDRDTRIQLPPVAQVSLPVPVALAGRDPLRTMRYDWWKK
jgi:hypothetical protein